MLIRVNAVQVRLSLILPPEEQVANYSPQRMQGTMIVALQLATKILSTLLLFRLTRLHYKVQPDETCEHSKAD